MEFGILHLSVDGTTENPYVVAALAIWACILSLVTFIVVRRLSRMSGKRFSVVVALAILYLSSPISYRLVGQFLYVVSLRRMVNVWFMEPAPWWAPMATGFLTGIFTYLFCRQR